MILSKPVERTDELWKLRRDACASAGARMMRGSMLGGAKGVKGWAHLDAFAGLAGAHSLIDPSLVYLKGYLNRFVFRFLSRGAEEARCAGVSFMNRIEGCSPLRAQARRSEGR